MRGAPQSRDVNILSRLELLCKDVGRPLLMTDTFEGEQPCRPKPSLARV